MCEIKLVLSTPAWTSCPTTCTPRPPGSSRGMGIPTPKQAGQFHCPGLTICFPILQLDLQPQQLPHLPGQVQHQPGVLSLNGGFIIFRDPIFLPKPVWEKMGLFTNESGASHAFPRSSSKARGPCPQCLNWWLSGKLWMLLMWSVTELSFSLRSWRLPTEVAKLHQSWLLILVIQGPKSYNKSYLYSFQIISNTLAWF